MPWREVLMLMLAVVGSVTTGCTTSNRTAADQSDPMLQKSNDDHAIHGQAGVFYGRTVGH